MRFAATDDRASTAIEITFPFAQISQVAERESYRKEVFRPIYHIHKWWATRLGTVFRAIALGAMLPAEDDVWERFYETHSFENCVVLDPFMGSGTTLGEAAKLGAKAIGCDINPISTFMARQALTQVSIQDLEATYAELEHDIGTTIAQYYLTPDRETGALIPVMYSFWVTVVETPEGEMIPLFKSYVFSKNAYPRKKPAAKILCPACWRINSGRYDSTALQCAHCGHSFNPQQGPAKGQYVIDSKGTRHKIIDLVRRTARPPQYRLYALMAQRVSGEKAYLEPIDYDYQLYERARARLQDEELPLPDLPVRAGYNTDQARKYNYTQWRHFFNDRQLLGLGLLLRRITAIENPAIRDQFICLFSSVLEFNNMFCSFKGEGTGAVRHMFSHHILKPERTPLENSIWGLPNSSGTFASLFKSRLLKAKHYLEAPFELYMPSDLFGTIQSTRASTLVASRPLMLNIANHWDEFQQSPNSVMVLNGDSSSLPLPDEVVDLVITDPPYFDFVHYSELSDFFYAWLAPVLADDYPYFAGDSSYQTGEVQHNDPDTFADRLANVFKECHRVLKPKGLLCFSFHHSRPEGWASIHKALQASRFRVVAAYPVHGEMKVATPKSNTKDPISLDMLLVCRKRDQTTIHFNESTLENMERAFVDELAHVGIGVSQTDRFNIHAALDLMLALQAQHPPAMPRPALRRGSRHPDGNRR